MSTDRPDNPSTMTGLRMLADNWNEVAVGTLSGSFDGIITDEMVDNYLLAMGNGLPIYRRQPDGTRLVPPDLVPRLAMRPLFSHFVRRTFGRSIRAKHEIRYFRPYHVGMRIRADGHLVEKYEKRGNRFLIFEAAFRSDGDEPMLHDRRTVMIFEDQKLK